MRYYYIQVNNEKKGPIALSDLKNYNVKEETLVWYHELESWKKAYEVDEIRNYILNHPPEINSPNIRILNSSNTSKKTNNQAEVSNVKDYKNQVSNPTIKKFNKKEQDSIKLKNPRYDWLSNKRSEAIVFGIIAIFVWWFEQNEYANTIYYSPAEERSAYDNLILLRLMIGLGASIGIVFIAKKLNRRAWTWSIAAFLFPGITLIIIGFCKKYFKNSPEEYLKFRNNQTLTLTNPKDSVNGFSISLTSDLDDSLDIRVNQNIEKLRNYLNPKLVINHMKLRNNRSLPFQAALILDKRSIVLTEMEIKNLKYLGKLFYNSENIDRILLNL